MSTTIGKTQFKYYDHHELIGVYSSQDIAIRTALDHIKREEAESEEGAPEVFKRNDTKTSGIFWSIATGIRSFSIKEVEVSDVEHIS